MDGFFNNLLVQKGLNENVVDDLGGYLYEQYFSRDNYSLIAICHGRQPDEKVIR